MGWLDWEACIVSQIPAFFKILSKRVEAVGEPERVSQISGDWGPMTNLYLWENLATECSLIMSWRVMAILVTSSAHIPKNVVVKKTLAAAQSGFRPKLGPFTKLAIWRKTVFTHSAWWMGGHQGIYSSSWDVNIQSLTLLHLPRSQIEGEVVWNLQM